MFQPSFKLVLKIVNMNNKIIRTVKIKQERFLEKELGQTPKKNKFMPDTNDKPICIPRNNR